MWLLSHQENESRTKVMLWEWTQTKDVPGTLLVCSIWEKNSGKKRGPTMEKAQDKLTIQVNAEAHIRSSASVGCSDGGQSYPTLERMSCSPSQQAHQPLASSDTSWIFMNIVSVHSKYPWVWILPLHFPVPPSPLKSNWIKDEPLHYSKILHLILLLSYPSLPKVLISIGLFLTISGSNVTMSLEMSDGVLHLPCTQAM